jgi:hypothetical protein
MRTSESKVLLFLVRLSNLKFLRRNHGPLIRISNSPHPSDDYDSHRLAPPHRDRDVLETNGNRITPDNALMEHFHPGPLDETELDQPAFEFERGKRGVHLVSVNMMDHTAIAALGQAKSHLRRRIVLISHGHGLYFQPRARRSSAATRIPITLERF